MEKKLPKLYKKEISKEHINNETICLVSKKKNIKVKDKNNKDSVEAKLNKLFKSTRYVFNIGVIIKTAKKDYDTKIIGKIRNSIITNENEEIPIVEIEDIIIKDHI